MCPVCEYPLTDEQKDLSYVERELEMSSGERFYKAWTKKYALYSGFPQECDAWSTTLDKEDITSLDNPADSI